MRFWQTWVVFKLNSFLFCCWW